MVVSRNYERKGTPKIIKKRHGRTHRRMEEFVDGATEKVERVTMASTLQNLIVSLRPYSSIMVTAMEEERVALLDLKSPISLSPELNDLVNAFSLYEQSVLNRRKQPQIPPQT